MAVLKESKLWPIHSARSLHDQAQQGFLWQFNIPGIVPRPDQDMMMLAQSCQIPGLVFERKSYSVAGQEHYYLGKAQRGGAVNVRFIETEDGKVDKFFRLWASSIDVPQTEVVRISRWRRPLGRGDGVSGHARTAIVRLFTRAGTVSAEFWLLRVQLVTHGPYDLSYESSGPLILPVTLSCDEVIRRP